MTRAKDISKILTDADISGNIDVDGVTNLDVVDIDGAVDMASTLTVGGAVTINNGELKVTSATGDNADKKAHFTTAHYDTDEENFGGLILQSSNGDNLVDVGGSQSGFNSATKIRFFTGANATTVTGTERGRINAQGLLINTTATLHSGVERSLEVLNHSGNGFVAIFKGDTAGNETVAIHNSATSGTRILLAFKTSGSTGTLVGRVTSDGSSATYATSSDYRLKENLEYNWDATTRLKQLKPARFNWIADESNTTVDGFIAHEVSSIVPEAVNGEKDAMTEELLYVNGDEIPDGKKVGDVKEASVIDPQGIDQSKLVPLLTKALQEQQATIEALTARIVTLEKA